jgi:hypothetical protein
MSAPLPPPLGGLPTVLGDDGVPMFVAYVSSQFSQSVPTSASSDEDSGSAAAAIQQGGAEAGAELVQPVIFAARTLPVSTDLHSARGTQPSP